MKGERHHAKIGGVYDNIKPPNLFSARYTTRADDGTAREVCLFTDDMAVFRRCVKYG